MFLIGSRQMNEPIEQDIVQRAQARVLLERKDYTKPPPFIVFCFVGCIGPADGRKVPNYEFDCGEIYEHIPGEPLKSFARSADESLEDFKARVIGSLPAVSKLPWAAVFYSPDIVTLLPPEPVQ